MLAQVDLRIGGKLGDAKSRKTPSVSCCETVSGTPTLTFLRWYLRQFLFPSVSLWMAGTCGSAQSTKPLNPFFLEGPTRDRPVACQIGQTRRGRVSIAAASIKKTCVRVVSSCVKGCRQVFCSPSSLQHGPFNLRLSCCAACGRRPLVACSGEMNTVHPNLRDASP